MSVSAYYTQDGGFPWQDVLAFASAHAASPANVNFKLQREETHRPFVSAWPGAEKVCMLLGWARWRRKVGKRARRDAAAAAIALEAWTPRRGLECLCASALRAQAVAFAGGKGIDRLDYGAAYDDRVDRLQRRQRERAAEEEGDAASLPFCAGRLLAFDIDVDDYPAVGACKERLHTCDAAWPLLALGVAVLAEQLQEDFGFPKTEMLAVYSGRRGVHLVVASRRAFELTNAARVAMAHGLSKGCGVLGRGASTKFGFGGGQKSVAAEHGYHPFLAQRQRLQNMLERAWQKCALPCQASGGLGLMDNFFGRSEVLRACGIAPESACWVLAMEAETGAEAYSALRTVLPKERRLRAIYEQLWPRIDVGVAKDLRHTLKAPFSAQPATGRVCVPLVGVDEAAAFCPARCPTVDGVLQRDPSATAQFDAGLAEMRRVLALVRTSGEARQKKRADALSADATNMLTQWQSTLPLVRTFFLERLANCGAAVLCERFRMPYDEERALACEVYVQPPGYAPGTYDHEDFFPNPSQQCLNGKSVESGLQRMAAEPSLQSTDIGGVVHLVRCVGPSDTDEQYDALCASTLREALHLCATSPMRVGEREGCPALTLSVGMVLSPRDSCACKQALDDVVRLSNKQANKRMVLADEKEQALLRREEDGMGQGSGPDSTLVRSEGSEERKEVVRRQLDVISAAAGALGPAKPADASAMQTRNEETQSDKWCELDRVTSLARKAARSKSSSSNTEQGQGPLHWWANFSADLPSSLPHKAVPTAHVTAKRALPAAPQGPAAHAAAPSGGAASKRQRGLLSTARPSGRVALYCLDGLDAAAVWSEVERLVGRSEKPDRLAEPQFVKSCVSQLDKFFFGPACQPTPWAVASGWEPAAALPSEVAFEEYYDDGGRLGYDRLSCVEGGVPTGWRGVKGMRKEVRAAVFQRYWHVDLSKCHTVMLLGSLLAETGEDVDCSSVQAKLDEVLCAIEQAQQANLDAKNAYSKEQAAVPAKVLLSSILNKDRASDPLLDEHGPWRGVALQHRLLELGGEAAWRHARITDEKRQRRPKDKTWMSAAARHLEAEAVAAMTAAIATFLPSEGRADEAPPLLPSISVNDEVLFWAPERMPDGWQGELEKHMQAGILLRLGFEAPFKIDAVRV